MIMDAGERTVAPLEMVAAMEHTEGPEYRIVVRVANDVTVNTAPTCSPPDGPSIGHLDVEYSFATVPSDFHSDDVYCQWSFGGDTTGWLGPYEVGVACGTTYQWSSPDTAEVKVRARDLFGAVGVWSDAHIVEVVPSCCELRADVNDDGVGPDIADLVYLVTFMFQGGPPAPCNEEADIDGNGSGPDIADLVYLVTYMFQGGTPPPPCS